MFVFTEGGFVLVRGFCPGGFVRFPKRVDIKITEYLGTKKESDKDLSYLYPYLTKYLKQYSGASIPPEARFRFPPYFRKIFRLCVKFSKFYLFPKNSPAFYILYVYFVSPLL